MHRAHVRDVLARYAALRPEDAARVAEIETFVARREDCFLRTCREGHITASAWILSPDRTAILLTHHRKLDRWLQLGGHADGDPEPLRVALREAREESGLDEFTPLPATATALPFDVDVHPIPARADEPAHLHYDLRYLLVAGPGPLRVSDESHELRWVRRERLAELVHEESVLRLERRARELERR